MTSSRKARASEFRSPISPEAKVDLGYTAKWGFSDVDPEDIARCAQGDGLSVIGITDLCCVDRIPALTVRALERGIWALPGIRMETEDGMVWAWGFDYQDRRLRALVAAANAGAILHHKHVIPLFRRLGGLVDTTDLDRSKVKTGDALHNWLAHLGADSLLRRWFDRLEWRRRYLNSIELEQSLWLDEVVVPRSSFRPLLDLPVRSLTPSDVAQPFVLVSPSGIAMLDFIRARLKACVQIVAEREITRYPELTWQLYGLGKAPAEVKRKALLRFDLDRFLYNRNDGYLFVTEAGSLDVLRELKVGLRRELGVRVYRVRHGNTVDTCVSTYLHVPDPDQLALEFASLLEF